MTLNKEAATRTVPVAIGRNPKVLVIDDDTTFTGLVSEQLSELGYAVETAHNGHEGLNLFRTGMYPLVLLDLNMPGMNGLEVLKHLKKIDKRAMVVVISGYATIASAVSAVKNGAHDLITKPVTIEQLEMVVKRALDRRDLLRHLAIFRGITMALVLSIPVWLVLGVVLATRWLAQ